MPTSDLLFRNNGNGTFTDISRAAGLTAAVGNGLGVIADDVNGDGRLDVFVANDGTPNHLWINLGGMRFAESALMWRSRDRSGRRAEGRHGRPRRGSWTTMATTS